MRRWAAVNTAALATVGLSVVVGAAVALGLPVVTDDLAPHPAAPAARPAPVRPDAWTPAIPDAVFDCGPPLLVVHNPAGMPADIAAEDVVADVERAVAAVGDTTHRVIRYGGTSDARNAVDVTRPDAPTVLISWVPDPADLDGAPSPTAIATGGTTRQGDRLVAGDVRLAASAVPPAGSGPGELEVVLRHELSHALGIAQHSTDERDVLYPILLPDKDPTWGPGDLAALTVVGCPAT